jgi:hypothetical protein
MNDNVTEPCGCTRSGIRWNLCPTHRAELAAELQDIPPTG